MDHNLSPQPGIARPVPLRVDYDELAVLLPELPLDDGLYHVVIDRRVRQLEFLFRVRSRKFGQEVPIWSVLLSRPVPDYKNLAQHFQCAFVSLNPATYNR